MSNPNHAINCIGLFGRLFGHNYQARKESFLSGDKVQHLTGGGKGDLKTTVGGLRSVLNAAKDEKYIGDRCTRCGDWQVKP